MKLAIAASISLAMLSTAGAWTAIRVSAYTPQPNQTDNTPDVTSIGWKVRPGIVALSRNLLKVFPYKSKVQISCPNGYTRNFTVADTMAERWYNKADIFMWSRSDALKWGNKTCRIRAL